MVIYTCLYKITDVILVQASVHHVLMTSPIEMQHFQALFALIMSNDDLFTRSIYWNNRLYDKTRGPWATTLIWMYSYEGYIQPKFCKCCMQEKLTFHLPWQLIKFSCLDLFIWLLEDYSRNITVKLLSKYLKSIRNKGLLSLFPL